MPTCSGRQLRSAISLGTTLAAKSPERVVTATEQRSLLPRGEPTLWKSVMSGSVEQCGGVARPSVPDEHSPPEPGVPCARHRGVCPSSGGSGSAASLPSSAAVGGASGGGRDGAMGGGSDGSDGGGSGSAASLPLSAAVGGASGGAMGGGSDGSDGGGSSAGPPASGTAAQLPEDTAGAPPVLPCAVRGRPSCAARPRRCAMTAASFCWFPPTMSVCVHPRM